MSGELASLAHAMAYSPSVGAGPLATGDARIDEGQHDFRITFPRLVRCGRRPRRTENPI
jgi:hypothetical protein